MMNRSMDVADAGTYAGNIVTSYLADTSVFEGGRISPLAYIDSNFVPGSFYAECVLFHEASEGSPPEHSHDDFDEIVMFFGTDPERPHELCGEVEWWMGGEKYMLTQSCMIFVPRGLRHCPVYLRRVDRPILNLSTGPSGSYRRDGIEQQPGT
jgi:quercetin dioxygenase-like cupin family protein